MAGLTLIAGNFAMAYPKPSISPISWELRFDHAQPRRIVVEVPGQPSAKAYWYMTYTVTNNSDHDVTFLPTFEWVTKEGKVIQSDKNIPNVVFEKIKAPLLAINSADDLIDPPELGILEKEIKRVPHGRALIIPLSEKTRGHQSHRFPILWKEEMARFLGETAR